MRPANVLPASFLLLASTALAYDLELDPSGAQQRVSGEVAYQVDANCPDMSYDQALPAIHAAFATWAAASQGRLSFTDQGSTSLGPPAAGETRAGVPVTISWELGQWSYEGDDQAVTLVVEDPGSHTILRADIVLNGVTHHWADLSDGQPHPGMDDLQNTLTHEIGHMLGFGHTTDTSSTMFPSTHPGDLDLRDLDTGDVAGLDFLYASLPTAAEQAAGCATGAGASESSLALLLLVAIGLRSRQHRAARGV